MEDHVDTNAVAIIWVKSIEQFTGKEGGRLLTSVDLVGRDLVAQNNLQLVCFVSKKLVEIERINISTTGLGWRLNELEYGSDFLVSSNVTHQRKIHIRVSKQTALFDATLRNSKYNVIPFSTKGACGFIELVKKSFLKKEWVLHLFSINEYQGESDKLFSFYTNELLGEFESV